MRHSACGKENNNKNTNTNGFVNEERICIKSDKFVVIFHEKYQKVIMYIRIFAWSLRVKKVNVSLVLSFNLIWIMLTHAWTLMNRQIRYIFCNLSIEVNGKTKNSTDWFSSVSLNNLLQKESLNMALGVVCAKFLLVNVFTLSWFAYEMFYDKLHYS